MFSLRICCVDNRELFNAKRTPVVFYFARMKVETTCNRDCQQKVAYASVLLLLLQYPIEMQYQIVCSKYLNTFFEAQMLNAAIECEKW